MLTLLLLAGGAVVNVAVAWSFCAYSKPKQANVNGARPLEPTHLLVYLPEEIHDLSRSRDDFRFREDDPRLFFTERNRGVHLTIWTMQYTYRQRHLFGEMTWNGPLIRLDEYRAGWPKHSFHSMKVTTSSPISHERRLEPSAALERRVHEWHVEDGLCVVSTVRSGMVKEERGNDMRRFGSPMPRSAAMRAAITSLCDLQYRAVRLDHATPPATTHEQDDARRKLQPWPAHFRPVLYREPSAATTAAGTVHGYNQACVRSFS